MSDKVLVVEDSKMFADLVSNALRTQTDFEVMVAYDYAQAKTALASHEFFIALLDLALPDAPNGEVVDLVTQQGVSAIVLTGSLDANQRKAIWKKNIVDYVVKSGPANIEYAVAMVGRIHKNPNTKVLVVDDANIARKHVRRLLELHRFQVLDAADGKQALEVLEQNPDIEIMIVDCHMPNMDGMQLTTEVRKKYTKQELIIVGVSGDGGQEMSAEFIKLGANDFMNKSFLEEEFYCRINQNIQNLEQVKKLKQLNDQKSKFLGIAAHDIKSPLSGVRGLADMMKTDPSMEGELRSEYLQMIVDTVKEIESLLTDLLDVSAIESGNLELRKTRGSLRDLVNRRVLLLTHSARKKNITITTELGELPDIFFDPERLTQVIDNLLTNAIKYSPQGSEVFVSMSLEGHVAFVSVMDDGPGLSEADQKKLFGAFARLSSVPTGGEKSTGLGLSIAKSIVKAHGGEIGCHTAPGEGSTFFFTLPF